MAQSGVINPMGITERVITTRSVVCERHGAIITSRPDHRQLSETDPQCAAFYVYEQRSNSLSWHTAQVIPIFRMPFVVERRKRRKDVLVVEVVMKLEVKAFDILERRDDLRSETL